MATVSMSKSYFVMLIILSVMGLFKISSVVNEALVMTTTSRTFTSIHNYNGTSLKTLISSDALKKMTEAYGNTYSKKDVSCPEGLVLFQDKKIMTMESTNKNTSTNSGIPNIIHFFAKSKCLPKQVHENLQKTWVDTIQDYSIVLHDLQEISTHLSKPRKDLPFVIHAYQCAFTHEAILDLARFVYLYDYGGISIDINQLPAPGFIDFANGNMRSTQDEYYIEMDGDSRFIAATPRHLNVYIHLQLSIANQYHQFAFNSTSDYWYHGGRNSIYSLPLQSDYVEDVTGNMDTNSSLVEKIQLQGFNPSTVIYSSRIAQGFLTSTTITEEDRKYIEFGNVLDTNGRDEDLKQCVDFTNDSFHVDLQDLIQVAGGANATLNATCPNNMMYQGNFFTNDVNNGTRKIPKILHMTSKNKCFTKAFAENIKQWIQPGYSFVLHDDEAVDRLFHDYEWNEFPLLKHVLTCLTGGAMKADLWRYLALWKWGGVYTDIDNAPGREWFKDGTFIDDNMDAVFEVERGGYPSQYFYAISPRHPASYFMVSTAIARILFNDKPMKRMGLVPWLTGPGTLKNALILSFGGNGYPQAGEYIGKSNRSMSILGSPKDAKQSKYVGRCTVREANKEDEAAMDMPHYLKARSKQGRPNYTCRVQIMKDSKSFLASM